MNDSFELTIDEYGKLTLKRPGQEDVADVRIRRAFPWSAANCYVSVRSSDGKELMLLEDLEQIDAEQRRIILGFLGSNTFIPRITRVQRIDLRFGYQRWKVETDRGEVEFSVQEREDIRFLPDGRFSVKDADGNVYELGRLEQLDEASRRAVQVLV
jgi:hypothetical protein